MSTDTWMSSHREINQHTPQVHPSSSSTSSSTSSSSSSSLIDMNFIQNISDAFNKFYSPTEMNSFASPDLSIYANYLNRKLFSNCFNEQQPQQQPQQQQQLNDNNSQHFQDLFHKLCKSLPQFDVMQKSLSVLPQTSETSPEKTAHDLTMNRGNCDLNISDFNCSNTTLGTTTTTLPSPSEKSSPYNSSLCNQSQHNSTEMNTHQTDNQQQMKEDSQIEESREFKSKLFSYKQDNDDDRQQYQCISNETMSTLHFPSSPNTNTMLDKMDISLNKAKKGEVSLNNLHCIDDSIGQNYKLNTDKLTQYNQCHYHNNNNKCRDSSEQSADEYHAINLSMKETDLLKTPSPPQPQPEVKNHRNETNYESLSNSMLYEYYIKLLQFNYFEWLKYLLCQSSQISGNPGNISTPIPQLSQDNNKNNYYPTNDKSCDIHSMNNILGGNQCPIDCQLIDSLTTVHNSMTHMNSDIFGLNYANNLLHLYGDVQSNFLSDNYQSAVLNSLSTIPSSLSPLKLTQPLIKDPTNCINEMCTIKSKRQSSTNSIIPKNSLNSNNNNSNNSVNINSKNQTVITANNNTSNSYACKLCSKVYSQASALKMHVRTHTLPCRCTHCGKSFSRKWLLKGHERTHTGERPYSCNICGRSFADRSNLRAHMQTHQREKRYSCSYCPRSFSRMGLLNKHILQCNHQNHNINNNNKSDNYCSPINFCDVNLQHNRSLMSTMHSL
ncbi:unnamed protein product [Trichobilharzia szidati]|nr:unnamed protein product [Trichobilharzia szidati]